MKCLLATAHTHLPEAVWIRVNSSLPPFLPPSVSLSLSLSVCVCVPNVVRTMGLCMVRTLGIGGMCHIHPAALKDDWSMRHAASLITPQHTYRGYLGGIFTSVLTNGKAWTQTWISESLSALAWVQAALLSGCTRGFTMRAMHQAIHGAYGDSPHNVQGTVKAAHHISYGMPVKKCIILRRVGSNGRGAWMSTPSPLGVMG